MKHFFVGMLAVFGIVGMCALVTAQDASNETTEPPQTTAPAAATEAAPPADESMTASSAETTPTPSSPAVAPQWVWGEVAAVDTTNKTIQIKHLDYDTYEEVLKNVHVTTDTLFENVSGINDLKVGDSVTVDFKMKDGAQVAELVVVDKNAQAVAQPQTNITETPAATPENTTLSVPSNPEMSAPTEVKTEEQQAPETPAVPAPAAAEDQTVEQPLAGNDTVLPSGNATQ